MLEFFEKGHRYELDGVEIPSVSEVTEILSKEVYGDIDEDILKRAAAKGTAVHEATVTLEKEGSVECDAELEGYVMAYSSFLSSNDVKWQYTEEPVHYKTDYAGTIDRYGVMNGERVIVDIKTTKSIGKKHKLLYTAAQSLYAMAVADNKGAIVDALYILQLKENGTYNLIKLDIDLPLATSCLTIYRKLKETKRRKKNG